MRWVKAAKIVNCKIVFSLRKIASLFFGGREATTGNASAVRRLLKLGKKCVNSAKKEKRERGNVSQFVPHKK